MRTLLWAVAVLALEVLLLWGYFGVTGMGRMASTTVALALLVGNVSVMVWLGFVSGFGQTLKRLLVAVLGCIILTYAALVVAAFVDLPTALVCEREGRRWKPPHTSWADASKKVVWGLVSSTTPRAASAGTEPLFTQRRRVSRCP